MMLPTFLIIGAQKSGTSWLHHQLTKHPEIFIPKEEIHFFDKGYNFSKGIDWYERFFKDAGNHLTIGEKTPDYLWANGIGTEDHLANVHENIFNLLPQAKLIIILRNPVDRAMSAMRHLINTKRIPPLINLEKYLFGSKSHTTKEHGVVEYGFYYEQIQAYYKLFDPQQIKIFIYEEDVIEHPKSMLKDVCEFIEIDSNYSFNSIDQRINNPKMSNLGKVISYYTPKLFRFYRPLEKYMPSSRFKPSQKVIDKLHAIYADENEKLFNLIGRSPRSWYPKVKN